MAKREHTMFMQTSADIPLLIISENSQSERRISPAWTVSHLKERLEPITGVPASSQTLSLKVGAQPAMSLQVADEEGTQLSNFPLQAYAEIHVTDTRPPGSRQNYTDVSLVPKYEMAPSDYESRTDSVLHYKRTHQIGRFDPSAPSIEAAKIAVLEREVAERGIEVGKRCQLLPESDGRRGTVAFVGAVEEIRGSVGPWVGVVLDEPTGKNDGSVGGSRYFECGANCGVFVRPERVEVGDFEVLDEFGSDEEF